MARKRLLWATAISALAIVLICLVCLLILRRHAKGRDRFLSLLNQGKSEYEQLKFDAATTTFAEAAELRPDSLDARLDLANALLAGKKPGAGDHRSTRGC